MYTIKNMAYMCHRKVNNYYVLSFFFKMSLGLVLKPRSRSNGRMWECGTAHFENWLSWIITLESWDLHPGLDSSITYGFGLRLVTGSPNLSSGLALLVNIINVLVNNNLDNLPKTQGLKFRPGSLTMTGILMWAL